ACRGQQRSDSPCGIELAALSVSRQGVVSCRKKNRSLLLAAVAGRGGVQPLAQFLAGAEEGHSLFFNRDGSARTRIASLPCWPHFDGKRAKATQLNTIPSSQSAGDFVKNRRDDALHIAV